MKRCVCLLYRCPIDSVFVSHSPPPSSPTELLNMFEGPRCFSFGRGRAFLSATLEEVLEGRKECGSAGGFQGGGEL